MHHSDRHPAAYCHVVAMSSTAASDYVPLWQIFNNAFPSFLYNLFIHRGRLTESYVYKNYRRFFDRMFDETQGSWIRLVRPTVTKEYYCKYGMLIEKQGNTIKLLATLVIRTDYLEKLDRENPDLSKFFLAVSKEFAESREYTDMYRNFKQRFEIPVNTTVDTVITKDIIQFCYKTPTFTAPKYGSLAQMKSASSEFHRKILNRLR